MPTNDQKEKRPFEIVDLNAEDFIVVGERWYIKPILTKEGNLSLLVFEEGKLPYEYDATSIEVLIKKGKEMYIDSW